MSLVSRRAIYASTADVSRILPRKWSIKLKFMIFVFRVFFGLFFYLDPSYLNSVFKNSNTNTQCPVVVCSSSLLTVLRVRKRTRSRFPTLPPPPDLTQPARHSFFFRCLPDGKSFDFVFQVSVQAIHQFRHRIDRDHVLRIGR